MGISIDGVIYGIQSDISINGGTQTWMVTWENPIVRNG